MPATPRMSAVSQHYYLSTACLHRQHAECRYTCKFCPADCICPCHHPREVVPPVRNIADEPLTDAPLTDA